MNHVGVKVLVRIACLELGCTSTADTAAYVELGTPGGILMDYEVELPTGWVRKVDVWDDVTRYRCPKCQEAGR